MITIDTWNDKNKNTVNDLLILVFALWTLIEKGEQNNSNDAYKKIYKFPHCA